ncbi:MAG: PIG-L deacetylase family protein [Promethearchaeota archaeon]
MKDTYKTREKNNERSMKMKIVVFEPHPDDLLFGPGPILLEWIEEKKHDIHVVTVTDGRACYRVGGDVYAPEVKNYTEDDVARMRIKEAKEAISFLGLPEENHHLFYFHDADGPKYVAEGIEKAKDLIRGVDRLVCPSKNNRHVDHQATHDIAVGAARELELKNIEYFIYFIPSYGQFHEDSKEKQFEYTISEEKAKVLMEWLQIYQSQAKIKYTWKMYTSFLKNIRTWKYAIFKYEDMGKYYNF